MSKNHPSILATRQRLKLTQAEFAARTGYSKSNIEKLERDERAGKVIRPRIIKLLTK